MQAAEIIVKILEKEGITDAFGIPGAGINSLYKYLGQTEAIKHYLVRHEEAAVHAADAYFRSSGRMAMAACTSGPGATNFVTGLYTANIDSIPLIAITGQAVRAQLGKDAFQCVDIAEICKTITKWSVCVTDPEKVPEIMAKAFFEARSGKPGPVLIDLPLDVQMAEIDYDVNSYKPIEIPQVKPDAAKISAAADLLLGAANPAIIMGGGVILSRAEKELTAFAEYLQIPVITTYMAKGGIPVNHPLNAGHAGIQVGQPIGNRILSESDVVLGVGCRFTDRHTGDVKVYSEGRKFIHIDIEPSQIGKIFAPEIGIVSDAKLAIEALMTEVKGKTAKREAAGRVAGLPALREELRRKTDYDTDPIKPQRVYAELNRAFDDNTMFTTGCGLNQIWSGQLQDINKPRRYLPSGGAGTLGFDIPAAVGAMAANPGTKCVAVMGDFGFTFMPEEIACAATYKMPLVVVVVNNAYLSLIRQNQKYAYSYEYEVHVPEDHTMIDYVKICEGLGGKGERVFKTGDIAAAFERAKAAKGPYIVDIIVEEDTDCSMGGSITGVREFE